MYASYTTYAPNTGNSPGMARYFMVTMYLAMHHKPVLPLEWATVYVQAYTTYAPNTGNSPGMARYFMVTMYLPMHYKPVIPLEWA